MSEVPTIEESNSAIPSQKYDTAWLVNCGLITAVAAFLRFFDLGLKPFHHDEGVNGFFLTALFRNGAYSYDPANYHGPTLYYISLFFSKIFGLTTVSVRMSVAIFGVLTVVLVFYLRPFIGKVGALAAALLVALSPGMVFISRYFIHEIFFVFLALAFVLSVLLFIRNSKAGTGAIIWMTLLLMVCFIPSAMMLASYLGGGNSTTVWIFRIGFLAVEAALIFFVMRMLLVWAGGRPIYMLLASASVSLMLATKETAFITLGTMAIAIPCVLIWRSLYKTSTGSDEISEANDAVTWRNFLVAAGEGNDRMWLITGSAIVFIYVFVLFFSSFFTFPEGISRAFEAYAIWTKTGTKDHTQSGFYAYLKWFTGYGQADSKLRTAVEGVILVLSALGVVIAFYKNRHRVAVFTALWAGGLFLAYSLIPYKTPWLALSFLLPMCIVGGYGLNELITSSNASARAAGILLGVIGGVLLTFQAYDLNFVNYDNNDRTYVYAHTKREFLAMMSKIDHYAQKTGKGGEIGVDVASPDYWPMVWYTNDYPKAVYHGKIPDNSNAELIIIKKGDQDREALAKLTGKYKYEGMYPLRPGVDLILLVRTDIADASAQDINRLRNP